MSSWGVARRVTGLRRRHRSVELCPWCRSAGGIGHGPDRNRYVWRDSGGYGLSLQSSAYGLFTGLATIPLLLSYVVWFYLTGHLVFAALHQLHGNRILQRTYSGDPHR
ncbi:MAG: hypothetical protein ACYCXG_05500 [Acidiferrobacter sp.]